MELEIEGLIEKIKNLEVKLAVAEFQNKQLKNEYKMLNLAMSDVNQQYLPLPTLITNIVIREKLGGGNFKPNQYDNQF